MATSSAAVAATTSGINPLTPSLDSVPLWDMDGHQVEAWVRSVHALFPKQVTANQAAATKSDNKSHLEKVAIASRLLKNLMLALTSVVSRPTPKSGASTTSPPSKRIKTQHSSQQEAEKSINDLYRIWFMEAEDLPDKEGAVLAQLSAASLVNAMSGQAGGVVDAKNRPLSLKGDDVVETAGNITLDQLQKYAHALKHTIATRAERDVLTTTPLRIQQMLCPETEPHEFRAIRKRVYDTVILGKGLNTSNADEPEANVPVATKAVLHDAEKYKKCKVCQNNDQSLFVLDRKNGDVICTKCGTVAMGSLMHEGSMYRKFEGEADRNHHGDAANPLYSNAHNMSTTLGGMNITSSAGNGWGTQSRGLENILRNAHAYTEMNISQFGEKDRRTRVGYKDRQKRDAFIQMSHVGDALNLHEAVVQRAKELFAGFRDDRELVQQFKGVVAACLAEAFDQLSRDGQQILKSLEQEEETVAKDDSAPAQQVYQSSRANRRNDLHSAKMAGKGGLLLDFSQVKETEKKPKESAANAANDTAALPEHASERKPAPTWDLDDCRSWLLEASRSIAKQWLEEGNNKTKPSKDIPKGTLDELEGRLVEHTLALCDQLEAELKSKNNGGGSNNGSSGNNKKVTTPRLQDLGTLSIRWQHAHERGSGGKGGVGNSGRTTLGIKPGERRGTQRTAGQILILKTSKKLGAMLNDPIAGDAFHRELRALVGRQEARKKKEMRDEAARQRFQQMKRKPWLQARAQAND